MKGSLFWKKMTHVKQSRHVRRFQSGKIVHVARHLSLINLQEVENIKYHIV